MSAPGRLVSDTNRSFMINGLGYLIDSCLISSAKNIKMLNENGCGRIQLNILVLQQNLKNVEAGKGAWLHKAALYFDLFSAGPKAVISQAVQQRKKTDKPRYEFTLDELRVILELCYSEAVASDDKEVAVKAKRGLDDGILQLSEHLWQA